MKTPLTAIITYVDLLKDPALSAEDRAKYIETLDKKSQRLKRLIEDLFEVSKAATRNVAMHYAEVDLAALLKQVQYELADKTEASGIDFRWPAGMAHPHGVYTGTGEDVRIMLHNIIKKIVIQEVHPNNKQ